MLTKERIFKIHDEDCNQKYADILPYSFHLDCVQKQGDKFSYLLPIDHDLTIQGFIGYTGLDVCLWGHDLIEDARMTYNDIIELMSVKDYNVPVFMSDDKMNEIAVQIAEVIYAVTDEKGKNRKERKSEKYYKELKSNEIAVFVKLADIAANTLFSKLQGSSMYHKYKKEFPHLKSKLYIEDYKEFFDYVENI